MEVVYKPNLDLFLNLTKVHLSAEMFLNHLYFASLITSCIVIVAYLTTK